MPVRCRSGAVDDAAARTEYPLAGHPSIADRRLRLRALGSAEQMASTAESTDGRDLRGAESERARKESERPIASYATLTGLFGALCVSVRGVDATQRP